MLPCFFPISIKDNNEIMISKKMEIFVIYLASVKFH